MVISNHTCIMLGSDFGLMLKTSGLEALDNSQSKLETQLISPNYHVILPTDEAPPFLLDSISVLQFSSKPVEKLCYIDTITNIFTEPSFFFMVGLSKE